VQAGTKTGHAPRRRLTPDDRRLVISAHMENPELSARALAGLLGLRPSTVAKILARFRSGTLDRDGFEYDAPLC